MKPLSLAMLQNVFCWGTLCDKHGVKSEEKTKQLSVAGAAKEIKILWWRFASFNTPKKMLKRKL